MSSRLLFEREAIELFERQACEQANACRQQLARLRERATLRFFVAFRRRQDQVCPSAPSSDDQAKQGTFPRRRCRRQ